MRVTRGRNITREPGRDNAACTAPTSILLHGTFCSSVPGPTVMPEGAAAGIGRDTGGCGNWSEGQEQSG